MSNFREHYQITWLKHNASTLAHYMEPDYRFTSKIKSIGERYKYIANAFSKHLDINTHKSNSILGKGIRILMPQFLELFENKHTSVVLLKAKYKRLIGELPIENNANMEIPDHRLDSRVRNLINTQRNIHYCDTIFDCPADCPVCCMEISSDERLSCGHYFHKSCIIFSGQSLCPMCRQEIELTREEHIKLACVKYNIPNIYIDAENNQTKTITAVHFNILPGEDLANDYYALDRSNICASMLVNGGQPNGELYYIENHY